jgi:Carboxypeptidase regulatory-like domain
MRSSSLARERFCHRPFFTLVGHHLGFPFFASVLLTAAVSGMEVSMRVGWLLCVAVSVLFSLPSTVLAQDSTISGTVTDTTEAVLPGVTITAQHIESGNTFTGLSDTSGNYRIGAMRPGIYKITAELQGFGVSIRDNVQLLVGQSATLGFKLAVASLAESLTVSADAPLLDLSQSKLGGNIDTRQMQELPVNGRNWMQLTMLAPGSRANDVTQSPTGLGGDGAVRTDPGYFQLILDGQQVTQTMAQATYGEPKYARDAMGEFQFVSGRFDATQGRSIGVLVNAVSKSGTNVLRGSGYGFFRSDNFKAADFVAKRVLPYSNQQVGGTIGGPIIQDRMHFFGYYEREREPTTFTFSSPYAAFNIPDLSSTRAEQTAGIRVDAQLSSQTRLLFRVNGWKNNLPIDPTSFNSVTGHPSSLNDRLYTNGQFYGAITQVFGATKVNEIKAGGFLTFSDQYQLNGLDGAPRISLLGYNIGPANTLPLRLNGHTWSLRDDFTMMLEARGRHEVKIGGDFLWNHDFYEWNSNRYGTLQANNGAVPANIQSLFPVWNDASTWNLQPLSPVSVRWTQSFASCSPISKGCGWSWVHVLPYAGAWIQDNWSVTSDLTLNLGLRWDLAYNWSANEYDVPPIRHKSPNEFKNIGPRLGFAYSLPDKKTVVRGGSGLYYIGPKDQWAHHTPINIQLAIAGVLNDGRGDFASNPFNGATPTFEQADKLVQDTIGYIASDTNRVPYAYQTSFGVQRQLGSTMAFQADYAWNASRREQSLINTNLSYNPATGVNYPFTDVSRRPWPTLGIVQQIFSRGESNYHALETGFTKRFNRRWQASATYTLSTFKDFLPQPVSGSTTVPFKVAEDLGNTYGPAEGEQRHRAVFNGIWDGPYGLQLSGLYFFGSGQRFTTTYGADLRNSGNYGTRLRPDGTIATRNDFVGRPLHRVDVRMLRRFPIGGSVKLEGSLEVFNLLNHANYGSYVTTLSSPLYGQPQQSVGVTYQPRMAQLGFRVTF